ncbi:MAG: ATP-binding protein, partial [Caldilineaceae bacterium]|nr:ATP-binding protein [Caldilineaceae bacterium]
MTTENQLPAENQTTIAGDVTSGGDFVARDKTIHGDEIGGDKVGGNKIAPQGYVAIGGQTVHVHLGSPDPSAFSFAKEAPSEDKSPYQGLNYFSFEDAHLFFGREQLTAELAGYLRTHHFLAVVGASGSGKSSLVRAGLIPALHYGEPLADGTMPPENSQHWPIHIMQPKAHPLRELAATLMRDSESDLEHIKLEDELAQDARVLDRRVSRLLSGGPADRLLLVVDQFEELFTLCKDQTERKVFVDNLLTAAVEDGVTTVVITLRADFYAHCFSFENLRTALGDYQIPIGPMSKDELRRAIEEPAKFGKWELEPGLVDLLLDDVGDEPGALPLLSHALLETWK